MLSTSIISYINVMVNIITELSMVFLAILSLSNLPYGEMAVIDWAILCSAVLCILLSVVTIVIKFTKRRNDDE